MNIAEEPSHSMGELAPEISCSKSYIHNTVHKDLGMQSLILRKRQLLENQKENQKMKAAALLNELKHSSRLL